MPSALLGTLIGIVGSAHCLTGAERSAYVIEGRTPRAVVFPGSVEEVSRLVAAAAAAGVPVIPWGGGTRMGLGAPPAEGAVVLGTRRLTRVVEHEPADLTATVEAGLTIAALQAALGAGGQWFPLDPPEADRATLGGVLAANTAGPRRHLYGTARDLVIGLRVVDATGAVVRAGGKVVKNVAGYDLVKLYVGSLGTLGIIVEATLKLRPRPEADRACWAVFADVSQAAVAAGAILAADLAPHSLQVFEPGAAARCGPADSPPGAAVAVGFDGLAVTVAWQLGEAARILGDAHAREVRPLASEPGDLRPAVRDPLAVATVGVLPAAVGAYLGEAAALVAAAGLRLLATAHAGPGLVTLALVAADGRPSTDRGLAEALTALRTLARAGGGHLVVERAPLGVRAEVGAWDPPGPAVALMRQLKTRLDPAGVMNPGRFVGGL
jgi:glycolate oxidase FAD binding subunit